MLKEKFAVAKEWVKSHSKAFAASAVATVSALGTTFSASALEGEATGGAEAIAGAKTVLEGVTGTLNIANIVTILGAGIAAAIGLVLLWWGARKLIRIVMSAFKKGKVSV